MATEEEESSILFLLLLSQEDGEKSTDSSSDKSMELRRSDESLGEKSSPDKSTGGFSDESMNSPEKSTGGSSDISIAIGGSDKSSMEEDEEESMLEIIKRRSNYSNHELFRLIERDQRYAGYSDKCKEKLVTKLHLYFHSVIKSEGFYCTPFPGPIKDLTTVEPKYDLIYKQNHYKECHNHLRVMAKSAIDAYNKVADTRFEVSSLENVTLWKVRYTYYISFLGRDEEYEEQMFKAIVRDNIAASNNSVPEGSYFTVLLVDVIVTEHEDGLDKNGSDKDGSEDTPSDKDGSHEVDSEDEDDFYETTTDEEEDQDGSDDEEFGPDIILSPFDNTPVTDDQLLDAMVPDSRSLEAKQKLLPKLRRYLKTINDSEGFECKYFPGHICGVTLVHPRQFVIDKRERYPEGYRHILFLASLAMNDHNKKFGTKFQVTDIAKVNRSLGFICPYYITFTARDRASDGKCTFQARVLYTPLTIEQEVEFCRPCPAGAHC